MHHILSLGGRRQFHALGDFAAELIDLHRNALHIDLRGHGILLIERLLGLNKAAGLFGDDPCVSVSRLVDRLAPCGPRIFLQIIRK